MDVCGRRERYSPGVALTHVARLRRPEHAPFSSETEGGFENEIASVLADELGAHVEYTWWAHRRGFFKNTLRAGVCDVVIGVPVGLARVRTTAPYYRSAFVFVTVLHSGLLAALLSLAGTPLYEHGARTARLGIDAVADQQRAGLVMWVPAGVLMMGIGLALFAAWLGQSARRMQQSQFPRLR